MLAMLARSGRANAGSINRIRNKTNPISKCARETNFGRSKPTHVQTGSPALSLSSSSFSSAPSSSSSRLSLNVPRAASSPFAFRAISLSPREIHSPSLSLVGSSERDAGRRDDRTCVALWERCKYNRCRLLRFDEGSWKELEEGKKRLIKKIGR